MYTIERLAIIGGGRMGEAILAGLLASGRVSADSVVVAEPSAERRDALEPLGVTLVADAAEAMRGADVVVLAVKPQVIDAIVSRSAAAVSPDALVVSIAAGVTCARLESLLPAGVRVVRVMPNTPALVGHGMSVVSGGSEATDADVELVSSLFAAVGRVLVLPEQHQDVATAISGSGPAYVALFVDALARAGVRHGLPRDIAQTLALQTLRGTVELIEITGQHPEQVADSVSSPGGTTIAAIESLESGGLRSTVASAVSAAVARAKELGTS